MYTFVYIYISTAINIPGLDLIESGLCGEHVGVRHNKETIIKQYIKHNTIFPVGRLIAHAAIF